MVVGGGSSSLPKALFFSQPRKSEFQPAIAVRSFLVQPGAPVPRIATASTTLVYDWEKSMMPMARPSYLHGMNWAWSRLGFIFVAGSRNQVRRTWSALCA